jgi:hypothetical protein
MNGSGLLFRQYNRIQEVNATLRSVAAIGTSLLKVNQV